MTKKIKKERKRERTKRKCWKEVNAERVKKNYFKRIFTHICSFQTLMMMLIGDLTIFYRANNNNILSTFLV